MLSLLAATLVIHPSASSLASQFAGYGAEILNKIQAEMFLPAQGLYAEDATKAGPGKVAYNWGAGELLDAMSAAAAYDRKYKPALRSFAYKLKAYWNETPPVAGYSAAPDQGDQPDRYYDDNEWVALALHEAGLVLPDAELLKQSERALRFALSGEDPNGGVFWREKEKISKNTCSTAPAIVGILAILAPKISSDKYAEAVKLYKWLYDTLHDVKTGLFYDNISVSGKISPEFYSYNTALMIDANALLYRATGDYTFGERARLLEAQSLAHWVHDDRIADAPFFAEKLVESMLVTAKLAPNKGDEPASPACAASIQVQRILTNLHKVMDSNGHYPASWDKPSDGPAAKWDLLSQASACRAFFLYALYLRNGTVPLTGPDKD